MDLISVIIPVYKVERYLSECVDSVLASTYRNLEIILVDDGSPDNCPEICDAYAQKDSRIKVIHQNNGGICVARNAGLRVATGTYIAFVDSDDVVSPYLYEEMVGAIEATNADWVACEFTRTYTSLPMKACANNEIRVLNDKEQQLSVLVSAPGIRHITWSSGYVWNKLYRKDLIKKPFLPGCLNVEDLQFNWDYLQNCNTMAILPRVLYYYRLNEESVTETYRKSTADKMVTRGISMSQTFFNIAEKNPAECESLTPYLISRAVKAMHGALFRMRAHSLSCEDPEYIENASKYIRKHWRCVWKQRDTYNFVARFCVVVFTFAYPLWLVLAKLLKNKLK